MTGKPERSLTGGIRSQAGSGKAIPYLAVWITSFDNLVDHLSNGGQFDLGAAIHAASTSAISNNDEIPFWEDTSQDLRKLTWSDTKSAMQTFTETLYVALTGDQTVDGIKTFTDSRQVINPNTGDGGIYVQSQGDSYTLDVEQYSDTSGAINSPPLFVYRELVGTATATSPMIEIWKDSTDSSSDTGDMLYYQMDGVERMRVTHKGALYWTSDATGLPYGSCYGNNIAWAQAGAVQNTWYEVSDTDAADGQLHLVTHDNQGTLTVTKAGRYLVNYSVSLECDATGHALQAALSVSGTESANGLSGVDTATASDMTSIGGTAILDLAANATIQVSVDTHGRHADHYGKPF